MLNDDGIRKYIETVAMSSKHIDDAQAKHCVRQLLVVCESLLERCQWLENRSDDLQYDVKSNDHKINEIDTRVSRLEP